MDNATGITDAVRAVLRDADDSLQLRQVVEILQERGWERTARSLRPIFQEREHAGEFVRAEIAGNVCYSLNPDFVPKRARTRRAGTTSPTDAGTGGGASPAPAAAAEPPPQAEVPASALSSMPAAGEKAGAAASPECSGAGSPATQDAPIASRPAAGASSTRSADLLDVIERMPPAPRLPFGLQERLGAIVQDIEEALDDACKAELPHALIRHLVSANNAANRAARALGR